MEKALITKIMQQLIDWYCLRDNRQPLDALVDMAMSLPSGLTDSELMAQYPEMRKYDFSIVATAYFVRTQQNKIAKAFHLGGGYWNPNNTNYDASHLETNAHDYRVHRGAGQPEFGASLGYVRIEAKNFDVQYLADKFVYGDHAATMIANFVACHGPDGRQLYLDVYKPTPLMA